MDGGVWVRQCQVLDVIHPASDQVEQVFDPNADVQDAHRQVAPITHQAKEAERGPAGLAQWLSERFLWKVSDATTFVLCDVPPPINESDDQVNSQRAVPALTRVEMSLDPTMSPREVAALYRQIRFKYFGSRHRPMTAKHVELAKFWASHDTNVAWKDLMAQWNKLHPRWAYKREQNFARDCGQARERLLGQNPVRRVGQPQ